MSNKTRRLSVVVIPTRASVCGTYDVTTTGGRPPRPHTLCPCPHLAHGTSKIEILGRIMEYGVHNIAHASVKAC